MMTLLVFLDVVMRLGFSASFIWSQELTLHLSAWFVLFGISYGLKTGAHIGVDALVKLAPPKVHRLLSIIAILLCLTYCGFILYGSWVYLGKMYKIGITAEDMAFPIWLVENLSESVTDFLHIDVEDPLIPLWFAQSILMLGFCFFSLRLIQLLVSVIRGQALGFSSVNEADEGLKLAKRITE
ncbi:MAG: TRAP transporter small permease [Gammaproteobacteria bacterium]|nr:TRAP transporter small permease [Gammaproteobacteria bacterium]